MTDTAAVGKAVEVGIVVQPAGEAFRKALHLDVDTGADTGLGCGAGWCETCVGEAPSRGSDVSLVCAAPRVEVLDEKGRNAGEQEERYAGAEQGHCLYRSSTAFLISFSERPSDVI